MSITLFLSRIAEPLRLASDAQIPDSWSKLDVLSQGLVSRYLARARGAPKDSDKTSPWVILRPFSPEAPRLYAVWNTEEPIKQTDIEALVGLSSECKVAAGVFSDAEQKVLRAHWSNYQEWSA